MPHRPTKATVNDFDNCMILLSPGVTSIQKTINTCSVTSQASSGVWHTSKKLCSFLTAWNSESEASRYDKITRHNRLLFLNGMGGEGRGGEGRGRGVEGSGGEWRGGGWGRGGEGTSCINLPGRYLLY